jgi:hypothetical protein
MGSNMDNFKTLYDEFIKSKDVYVKENEVYLENVRRFVDLPSNESVTSMTNGFETKDGMYINYDSISDNDYCDYSNLSSSTKTAPSNLNTFNDASNVFYAEQHVQQNGKPCGRYNELVMAGMDDFSYNEIDHGKDAYCLNAKTAKFPSAFMSKQLSNTKCTDNHFEICQSMAKMKQSSSKVRPFFGVGNVNDTGLDECHCYISNTENMGNQTVQEKSIVDIHDFKLDGTQIVRLMMDGSLMAYTTDNIHDTHNGLYGPKTSSVGKVVGGMTAENASCNPYVGAGPYDLKIKFDQNNVCFQV